MTVRTTLKLDPSAAPRDPRRPRVRSAAPLPTKVASKGAAPARGTRPAEGRPQPAPAARAPSRPRDTEPPVQQRPSPPSVSTKTAPAGLVRLSKLLSDRGLASRRQADDWIAAGWVRVDGTPATLGLRVLPSQRIDIDPAARAEPGRSGSLHRTK